jgi:hypothetical protein
VYRNIIQPLAEAWKHSTVVDKVKDNVVLFKPEVKGSIDSGMQFG